LPWLRSRSRVRVLLRAPAARAAAAEVERSRGGEQSAAQERQARGKSVQANPST
jgi:hypothetical protein